MNEIKKKILEVSRDLFIEQGYKETTTRQILQKAGILNGSLYHFFKDKEDIFRHIIVEANEETMELSKELAVKYAEPLLTFAFPPALLFYVVAKHDRLAAVFLEAYSAWSILDVFARNCAERMRELYHEYNPGFTAADYFINALAIVGCMRAFIAEGFFEGKLGHQDKLAIILAIGQKLFHIPAFDSNAMLAKIAGIIASEPIVIYGVKV